MSQLLQDLRFSFRSLRSQPGFSAVVLITLAIGIGAVVAVFSLVDTIVLRPLPYPQPDRVVTLWQSQDEAEELQQPLSPHNFFDVRESVGQFEDLAAYVTWDYTVAGLGGAPERLKGSGVSESFFRVMGAKPVLGRTFTVEEDKPGNSQVAVLSYGMWQRHFASDPNVLGRSVVLEGAPYTIVGVIEPAFAFPAGTELWLPMGLDGYSTLPPGMRARQYLRAVGRLSPDATLEATQSELDALAARLRERYPEYTAGLTLPLIPLHEQMVGDVRPALWLLLGAVCLVLLIACANVANLLLARSAVRRSELAVRTAMGAGRGRIVRQLLTESLLLAIIGGALGLLLAWLSIRGLRWFGPDAIPRLREVALDPRILAFTLGASLLTGLVFGLLPAIRLSSSKLMQQIGEGGRGSGGGLLDARTRGLLVVGEVALALTVLFATGLVLKSFNRLTAVEPGFDSGHVLTLEVTLIWAQYDEAHESAGFYSRALEGIEALPGVESAGVSCYLPLSGAANVPHGKLASEFGIVGRPREDTESRIVAFQPVSPDYFETLGIPVISGRAFRAGDDLAGPRVALVSESLAERYFPGTDPVGESIRFAVHRGPVGSISEAEWQVVGVVGDVRESSLHAPVEPHIYFPMYQSNWRVATFVVRTAGDPMAVAPAVRQAIHDADADQAIARVRSLEEVVYGSVGRERFNIWLLVVFGAVALLLAGVGIYGVVSYSVSRRAHEIGVRLALGAGRSTVLRMVVVEGLLMGLAGVAVGIALTAAVARLLRSQLSGILFEVGTTDLTTFAAVSVVLAVVALLASYLPARRATRIDPVQALRFE